VVAAASRRPAHGSQVSDPDRGLALDLVVVAVALATPASATVFPPVKTRHAWFRASVEGVQTTSWTTNHESPPGSSRGLPWLGFLASTPVIPAISADGSGSAAPYGCL